MLARSPIPALLLGMTVGVLISSVDCRAQSFSQRSPTGQASFSIPAQPLAEALMAYAEATGVEVFVDHDLVRGQRSAPVSGTYTYDAGLRELLGETGLAVRRAGPRSFTLIAESPIEPPVDRTPSWTADSEQTRFFAVLQTAVRQLLCATSETAPGRYRAVVAIWFDPAGRVTGVRLLSSTIDPQAARGLADGMQHISIGAPPRGLQQPVTLLLLPRMPDQVDECSPRWAYRR